MVLNTQMGGEAMWFWYATLFRRGAKLYSGLHTALQPLFVLDTAVWISLFGKKIAVYEVPSLIYAALLALGYFLVLRESDWPDWQKAVILFGSFVFTVLGHSYRFDDYHVIAELLILYALLLLLRLGRPAARTGGGPSFRLVAALGVVCGLTFVTRVTDGAALIVAAGVGLWFLLPRQKGRGLLLYAGAAAVTALLVVLLAGDTISAYLSNSIFRAAGSKGGTGSILAAPFAMLRNTLALLRGLKIVGLYFCLVVGAGWAIARYWKRAAGWIVPVQLALAAILFCVSSGTTKARLRQGFGYEFLVLLLTTAMYLILVLVAVRYLRWRRAKGSWISAEGAWDPRETLVLLPVLEWASYSAAAAAEPLTNYYAPVVLLLLLVPTLQPFRRQAVWVNPTLVTTFALVAFSGIYVKVKSPYAWQNYAYGPMFHNRRWFQHPVYGPMYIDRDLLAFSLRVCRDMGAVPGKPGPELLSLPYPYPNYFCDTPPWHNYVQTFFDTAPRSTIERMEMELATDPPQWIVYQRQLNIMAGAERLYNHGRPLAQRDLDGLIMGKIASGQWRQVDESSYLKPDWWKNSKDTDWYIIETHP